MCVCTHTWIEKWSTSPPFIDVDKKVAKAQQKKSEASGYHDVRK